MCHCFCFSRVFYKMGTYPISTGAFEPQQIGWLAHGELRNAKRPFPRFAVSHVVTVSWLRSVFQTGALFSLLLLSIARQIFLRLLLCGYSHCAILQLSLLLTSSSQKFFVSCFCFLMAKISFSIPSLHLLLYRLS